MNNKLLIISPIYFGTAGGAAIYYQTLAKLLKQNQYKVVVVSERITSEKYKNYYGLFPSWAGRDRNMIRDIFYYFLQNITYFWLISIIAKEKPETILIHSSFLNHPGVFGIVLKILKILFRKIDFIVDVRDRLLPRKKIKYLYNFDKIICCSQNVCDHLLVDGKLLEKIHLIPVIQEKIDIQALQQNIGSLKKLYKLNEFKYIIYAGAVKEDKAVDVLLEAYIKFVRPKYPGINFVIIGLNKFKNLKNHALLKVEGVIYLGNLPREDSLPLMGSAELCVNISPNEGLPRVSLEALALNKPTLLPPNVPEFNSACPEYVVQNLKASEVGSRICDLLNNHSIPDYPINLHYPENIISSYEKVFNESGRIS